MGKASSSMILRLGEHYAGGSCNRLKLSGKGHQQEVEAFLKLYSEGQPSPIAIESLLLTSIATFAILDSLRTGWPQSVSLVPCIQIQVYLSISSERFFDGP